MTPAQETYRTKRIYETKQLPGRTEIRLNDRVVELGDQEFAWYKKVAEWLPSIRGIADLSRDLGMDEAKVPRFLEALEKTGLLCRTEKVKGSLSGLEFHARFSGILESW